MRNLRYFAATIACFAFITSTGFAAQQEGFSRDPFAPPGATAALLELDFSDLIDQCDFISMYDNGADLDIRDSVVLRASLKAAEDLHATGGLGDRELARLGILLLPDGERTTLLDLHQSLLRFHAANGRLPDNAVELFPELAALDTGQVAGLDRDELFLKYAVAINPITGRFYAGFSDMSWSPGGYYVDIAEGPDEVAERFPRMRVFIDPSDPTAGSVPPATVWQITVYGDQPGEVIFTMNSSVGSQGE